MNPLPNVGLNGIMKLSFSIETNQKSVDNYGNSWNADLPLHNKTQDASVIDAFMSSHILHVYSHHLNDNS